MLLALPDQKSNTILVNWDRVTYAFQSGPNTVTTLKTPEGDIYLNVGIEELEEAVRAEEQRLADLTKIAR